MRNLFDLIRSDFARCRVYGWGALHQQGWWAMVDYRIGHWARHNSPIVLRPGLKVISLFTRKLIEVLTGIGISPNAHIGRSFYINHFGGIFINSGAVIGDWCSIMHGVTIGSDETGGVPRIGDHVSIGVGATIFGPINVGDNAKIGAGAVVLTDIPPNATAVGVPPARIITRREKSAGG